MDQPDPLSTIISEALRQGLDSLKHPIAWISSRANRARLRGARVEVMAFIVSRNPEPSILLGQSPYHSMWMPPQEGVNLQETFEDAVRRCLATECGVGMPTNADLPDAFYLRSIRYMGEVKLPRNRVGERNITDDALGTWLEQITLRRKAYWMATLILANQADVITKPDGRELVSLQWFSLSQARVAISDTNHAEKAQLLLKSLDKCEQDLTGAPVRSSGVAVR